MIPERTEATTPTAIIKQYFEIRKVKKDKNQKVPVVLLSTGSFNPVHRKHIGVFVEAKKLLEEKYAFDVLCGFISPSHDSYVSAKLGSYAINGHHRLEMIRKGIEEAGVSNWLFADSWEVSVHGFFDFPIVAKSLRQYLSQFSSELRVLYLCGTDHVIKCGYIPSLRKKEYGLVVMNRPGYKKLQPENHMFVLDMDDSESDVSSTMIRQRLAKGQSINDLTFSSVEKYIKDNKILHGV